MRTILAVAAVAFLALAGETVAIAADAPAASSPFADPSCPKIDEVEAVLDKQHETYVVMDLTDALPVAFDRPVKFLLATFGEYVVFGYEDPNGCLNGPTPVAKVAKKVGA